MASSSSSTPSSQSQKKYEVFISFRGEDIRFNFTSHLYEALHRKGIETYIDYIIEKGDEVWPALEKAIEDSTLFLVIFSENYASSTWCLRELTKILECSKTQGLPVMPVFYRVDPSHVRNRSDSYQKAFEELEHKRINKEQLQQWREALKHAANLSGWHCKSDRNNEAELITEILDHVIKKLNWVYKSEEHLKDLVGIDKRMADVESLLSPNSNNVRFIGIWGMGGIGKTTLAEALFNRMYLAYEDGFCFFTNVREESKKCGIDCLRKNLVLKLLGDKESNIGMGDVTFHYAMRRLSRKKILLVLDDVDDSEHLEKLAGRHDLFGPGSRILITTRDKQVLISNKVDYIYQLKGLNYDEAFQLFSLNAFKKDYGDSKMRELAIKVFQYAYGNPLALKVLGSLLCGKNQEAWESQLEKLQKLYPPTINDILKLSFEGLDDEEKNVFLHIVCFFNDYDVKDVKKWLDACGYSTSIGLGRLQDKALLDTYRGRICLHHLIKEMGRQIVREESLKNPKMCNILWISKKNSEILKKNKGSEATQGLILNLSEVEEMCLSSGVFRSMPNLKFLNFYGNFNGRFGNKLGFSHDIEFLSNKLILLRWVGYPSKSLPATFNGENLVLIEMRQSKLTKLWDGIQNLLNLTEIDLTESEDLIELPNFSKAIHLKKVDLYGCSKLESVHPSILSLHSLRHLRLNNCGALISLTSNTHLRSLEYLGLQGCSKLNEFSVTSEDHGFGLVLSETAINGELCSSSGSLSKIHSLGLYSCKSVTSLHKLVDLRNLRYLYAYGCNKLALNLRPMFDRMRALEVLHLIDCSELFELPDNIRWLSSLRILYLKRSNIETLPLSIKHLLSLHDLCLDGCERLLSLPELPPSISTLSAWSYQSLGTLLSPLTNKGEEGKRVLPADSILTNCFKLDGQSIKAIEAKVVHEIDKAIYHNIRKSYTGELGTFRITESLITVDLSSIPQPWDGTFIFCTVISKSPASTRFIIDAKSLIDGQRYYAIQGVWEDPDRMLSDHVFLWYDPRSCRELQRKIEEKKREAQSNTCHPLFQIQFTIRKFIAKEREAQSNTYHPLFQIQFRVYYCKGDDESIGEIKECGLCPTSAIKYQSDIKKILLSLPNPHPNSIAMEAASRKRKYHSLLR